MLFLMKFISLLCSFSKPFHNNTQPAYTVIARRTCQPLLSTCQLKVRNSKHGRKNTTQIYAIRFNHYSSVQPIDALSPLRNMVKDFMDYLLSFSYSSPMLNQIYQTCIPSVLLCKVSPMSLYFLSFAHNDGSSVFCCFLVRVLVLMTVNLRPCLSLQHYSLQNYKNIQEILSKL